MRFATVVLLALLAAGWLEGQTAVGIGPARGALVIVGGGSKSAPIFRRFVELAGGAGAPIVVVPTAAEGEDFTLETAGARGLQRAGARNLRVLHTRDRRLADSEEFVAPIRGARGVWFGGGRQWRLADAYLGTRTQAAFAEVLERGGVVGGSSAGATIQGSFLVRGDPRGNTVMVSPGHVEGFGFLKDSAIDQHVLARKRENDLIPVIQARPHLLGIGLDEDTAIIVRGDEFEVMGASKVLIYDARAARAGGGTWWTELGHGERFDLRDRRRLPAQK